MTDTTPKPAALEPAVAGALEFLKDKPGATLTVLAEKVAVQPEALPVTGEAQPFPDLPEHVELTDRAKDAMKALAGVFNSVELDKRRSLTQAEIDRLTLELGVIAEISSVLGPRFEAIKEIIRVHMDVDAEERGVAVARPTLDADSGEVIVEATPRDQKGHYLLAGPKQPHNIQSGAIFWSQQYSAGKATPSDAELQAAYAAGEIDRKTYLAVTREARPFDQVRFMEFLRKSPQDALALLRRITKKGKAQSSLFLREQ